MKIVNIIWETVSDEELKSLPTEIELPYWIKSVDYADIDAYISDTEECRCNGYTVIEE